MLQFHLNIPTLDLLPSHIDLVGAELEMINLEEREMKMKNTLEEIRGDYDYIIIDLAPTILVTDTLLIPIKRMLQFV